jgi:hypothetical protein
LQQALLAFIAQRRAMIAQKRLQLPPGLEGRLRHLEDKCKKLAAGKAA